MNPDPHPNPGPDPNQALGDSEQGFSEDDYIGLFDEVKFPSSPPREDIPPTPPTPTAAPSEKTRDNSPSEKDGLTLG